MMTKEQMLYSEIDALTAERDALRARVVELERLAVAPVDVLDRLTRAVRAADETHEREGGSSRHYVRDCLMPTLATEGLSVVAVSGGAQTPHTCGGCGRSFSTAIGLGQHFTWQRKKHGVGCSEIGPTLSPADAALEAHGIDTTRVALTPSKDSP